MRLSAEQVDEYFDRGYLILRGVVPPDRLAAYNQRFVDLVEGKEALAPGQKIMQDVMVVKGAVRPPTPLHAVNKMLCLEDDPQLFGFAHEPLLHEALTSLLGEELYSLSSNVFNKPPGVDGRHPMHQDLRYFKLGPADRIVGVWTAILPATRASGCLAVIPGSHREGIREHELPDWEYVNHGFYGIEGVDMEKAVYAELEPGDTLLFHPLLIHGSGHNESDDFRRAISIHVAAGDCQATNDKDWRRNPFTRRLS